MMTRVRRHPLSLLAAFVMPLALVAGCGGDAGDDTATDATTSSSASTSPSPTEVTPSESASPAESPKGPACDEVWVDGARLPGRYQECYSEGQRAKADGRYCEFGKPLVTYDGRFWAVPGGPIFEVKGKLLDDAHYREALTKCTG